MKSSTGVAVVVGGLAIWGGYWAWRKMQVATGLQISLDTFVFPNMLKLRFRNAAGAGVTVDAVFLNLYLGAVKLSEVNSDAPFYIEGRSQTSVNFKLLINPGTLLQTAGGLLPVIMNLINGQGGIPKGLKIVGKVSAAGNQIDVNQSLSGVTDFGGRSFGGLKFGQFNPQDNYYVTVKPD